MDSNINYDYTLQTAQAKQIIDLFREEYYSSGGTRELLLNNSDIALMNLANLNIVLASLPREWIGEVHCGPSFKVNLEMILEKLRDKQPINENTLEGFEAYLNQTKLPVKK